MKIAVVYNRESRAVINLFGVPNREKYSLGTIRAITGALRKGGHQVKSFEGDKNLIQRLEDFMPSVIAGERPGLVFNLSYGIQGKARYTHVPGMLEMLGVPYVGSSPDTHALALDKVVTKMILRQKGLPTPNFDVLENPESELVEDVRYPLIVKPKNEAVSYGLRVVRDPAELCEGVRAIYEKFGQPTLVEEFIEGREVSVGLLGNNPPTPMPPVALEFGEGEQIYTHEDKLHISDRVIQLVCPALLPEEAAQRVQSLAVKAFAALGCSDFARVDFRLDREGEPYILEVNSMASLGKGGSFVFAAARLGLDYDALVNRIVDVTSRRYFGTPDVGKIGGDRTDRQKSLFTQLVKKRDDLEKSLKEWTNLSSRTSDAVGVSHAVRKLDERLVDFKLEPVEEFTNGKSAWTWQTRAGMKQGALLVVNLDVPVEGGFPVPFRREPEWLFGEGIATSRAGIVCVLGALRALRAVRRLRTTRIGVFAHSDEGQGMRYSEELLKRAAQQARGVLVLRSGLSEGRIVNQRRGMRKYSLVVEGDPLRIGAGGGKPDALGWFLTRAGELAALSEKPRKLSVAVQDVRTERYSVLLPHRVLATVVVTFLYTKHADAVEDQLRKILVSDARSLHVRLEKLEERSPMTRGSEESPLSKKLFQLSGKWKLPFGVGSSLLPSAAGEIPSQVPVVCGFGPQGVDLYTPTERIHRGELLQRSLQLALLLEASGEDP